MIFRDAAPRAEMDFVDGDRRFEPIFLGAGREPIGILPLMVVETGDNGAGARAELGTEGVGIGFEREKAQAGKSPRFRKSRGRAWDGRGRPSG